MKSRILAAVLLATLGLLSSRASGQTVVDGDTIKLKGTTYRLWGIDAPEVAQPCLDGWMGGVEATKALAALIRNHTVTCEGRETDRFRRTVAVCRADGEDLGAAMVSTGMAYAFTRYSSDYVVQERAAIGARLGGHAHDCEKPWDWRKRRLKPAVGPQ
jgi:endonuclease YncB( thermonuclease family)